MADVGKIYPTDFHLLKKELEVQGELLSTERVERKAEIDQLRLELETLKRLIDLLHPGTRADFDRIYAEQRQVFNPELRKKTGT